MKPTGLILAIACLGFGGGSEAAETVLTADFLIVHAADAPPTVAFAAQELRRVLARGMGTALQVVHEAPDARALRLVSDDALPHDGFEIRLTGDGVTIAGNDREPADLWDVPSHGTLFGAWEFLERFVGARWLFPGELGEDVPTCDVLRIHLNEPLRGAPSFAVRAVAYLGESEREIESRYLPTIDWMKRQRLTNALDPLVVGYGHSWDDYLKPADLEAHPEWKSTNGPAVRNDRVMYFCTTAPGLIELFAQRVIENLDRNPRRPMTSISPTDGGGFCTCERCRTFIQPDPYGKPNHAAALLDFYRQVAEIVARERPGRRLGGFVYYNYQYPPAVAPKLPDNLSLCWAPLNYYGYGLLKPVYRGEFAGVLRRWSETTPHLFYHNYSTWMRSYHGAPLPVSLDVLRRELPQAALHRVWGARMVGTSAWGVNGPINYLLAKQLWNANLDVDATLDEWLRRAYGPGGRHMRALYDELDVAMARHKEAQSPVYKGSQYEVNEEVMKAVYAPLFSAMERHYVAALAECATDVHRDRLRMFGDNLTQLHFALRKAGLVADDPKSAFHRDDAEFARFLREQESSFSLYRDARGLDHGPIWQGEYRAP